MRCLYVFTYQSKVDLVVRYLPGLAYGAASSPRLLQVYSYYSLSTVVAAVRSI